MARVPAVRTKVSPLGLTDLTPTQSQLVEMGNQQSPYLVSFASHVTLQGDLSRLKILNGVCFGYFLRFSNSFGSLVLRQS